MVFFIAPVPAHCFSITLTQENREACTDDELSWKMCINFVWREKRRECQCGIFFIGRVPSQCQCSWRSILFRR